jgi:hypothetical protein
MGDLISIPYSVTMISEKYWGLEYDDQYYFKVFDNNFMVILMHEFQLLLSQGVVTNFWKKILWIIAYFLAYLFKMLLFWQII